MAVRHHRQAARQEPRRPIPDGPRGGGRAGRLRAQLKENAKLKDFSRIPQGSPPAAGTSGWRKWVAAAAILLLPVVTLAVTEFTGVTHLLPGRQNVTAEHRAEPPAQARPATDGWEPLFNGKDLTGWKYHPDQPGNWRVDGGILIGSNTSSYLFSDAGDYADFHLRVEARINRGGDSGIFFRSPFAMRPGRYAGTLRPAGGYEAELHRSPGHQMPTGSLWNAEATGTPKPLWTTADGSLTKDDEWFVLEVITRGNHLVTRVNGTQTADCDDPEARFSSGHIALQALHPQTAVQFRKVEIKRLPAVTHSPPPPTFTNGIGMEFVRVPKGKSWLGGGKDKLGDREVEIKEDFYLGKYEVTQEDWEKVMFENPSHFSRNGAGKDAVKDIPDADLKRFPVEMVSYQECKLFVAMLNKREKETAWVYRLPTELEREYACRGGPMADRADSAFDFYFGKPTNTLLLERANFGWKKGLSRTCKVGSYEPNRLGLYDLHGNVGEWCVWEYDTGPPPRLAVCRGGSWSSGDSNCTNAGNGDRSSGVRWNDRGLRLARVPADTPSPDAKTPPPAVPPFSDADVKRIAALPAEQQVEEVRKELVRRNPGFDGKLETKIEDGVVTEIRVVTDKVTDIAPIRVFNALQVLDLSGTWTGKPNGLLADLTAIKGMSLGGLKLLNLAHNTRITDADLMYFEDCKKLAILHLNANEQVTDAGLTSFKDCKALTLIHLAGTNTGDTGLTHFKDCKELTSLHIQWTNVTDAGLAIFKGMPLKDLWIDNTAITDLKSLQGMPLEDIRLTPKNIIKGLDAIREMKSLTTIGIGVEFWPAAEFWQRYDKGEFKQ
ncbi:MAG: family 16 glycoside hydrolase [Gemmataceae bacterium]